ncbi:nucleotidyltransferase domain-containing protein, partial [Candidatus Woesearchaeota archaeon]|nr:nucleotidyltransferase domain-containing protein [Candidatus Woesearchaeota archaeon]
MKILDEIRPAEKEKQKVRKIIKSVLEKIKIMDAKLELGGSYAKDTFLSGNHDIDVFVKFPYLKYKNKDIS